MDDNPMKLFGSDRPAEPAPAAPIGDAAPARPSLFRSKGFKRFLSGLVLVLVIAVCIVGYTRANSYGTRIKQEHPVDARIEITNPPSWLDRRIVSLLLDEAYQFAQKDLPTYNRARNTQDAGILREFADLYTGANTGAQNSSASSAPAPRSRQSIGYNAWIKRITEVRRDVARDKSIQTIQIAAEWRTPVAWVRVNDGLYLIDAEGIRLPGDYRLEDRPQIKLLALTGVSFPKSPHAIPAPGQIWSDSAALAPDLRAGMQLVAALRRQPFAAQINEIDLSNHAGRVNPRTPWIVFNTIYPAAAGGPTHVEWGRPIGEEKYYEVQSSVKIKTLNELFTQFGRIDSARDYVDIRTEVVRLPKLSTAAQ
ncbi:MAG TPA: hypothetical protein VHM90_20160 [Phycisphaerae bacterium]|nr:hypothetical protein [Phycisphaerae bacterium]